MTNRKNKIQLFILVGALMTLSAGDAMADPPCGYLKNMTKADLVAYRNKVANNGGYVFAFRHSNKSSSAPEGLTPDGTTEAIAGNGYLQPALNPPGGIEVIEMKYTGRQRVTQTRVGITQGCALNKSSCLAKRGSGVRIYNNATTGTADFVTAIDHSNIGSKNIFVFANSTELDEFNKGGSPNISCLEGIVYEAANPPGSNEFKCYRFFPSEWAATNPINANRPVWMDRNQRPDKDVSRQCRLG